jgi:hypothetical protein
VPIKGWVLLTPTVAHGLSHKRKCDWEAVGSNTTGGGVDLPPSTLSESIGGSKMANHKAEDFTTKEIEELVDSGDYRKVLMFGTLKSRELAYDVIYKKMNGGDWATVYNHKDRIKQLQAKLAEVQQQRDAQVPDPKKYIAFEELRTPKGMRFIADLVTEMADRIEEQEQHIAQLEKDIEGWRHAQRDVHTECDSHCERARAAEARVVELEAQLAAQPTEPKTFEQLVAERNRAQEALEAHVAQREAERDARLAELEQDQETDLDSAAPHGGSDNDVGAIEDPTIEADHEGTPSNLVVPDWIAQTPEPAASDSTEPVIVTLREYKWTKPEHNTPYVQSLNAVVEELGLPGFFDQVDSLSRTSFSWVVDGAVRYVKDYAKNIIEHLRSGELTFDPTKHRFVLSRERLQPLDQEPEADADLEQYDRQEVEKIYRGVKSKLDIAQQQLAERETPAEIVSGSADLEQELAETKTLLRGMTEAKDKVILRNRELEAENETLKTQLAELQAKLEQYEGMGA